MGLDGVPFSLLKAYLDLGILPNLQRILKDGHSLSQMDASLPEVSSTSWTSFITGTNPGEHGIFGFMDLSPQTYRICFPDARSIKAPTIWEIVGDTANGKESSFSRQYKGRLKASRRSVILNVPQTNPALPMSGVLVAGFVALDLKTAVYPYSAYRYLESMRYVIDVDATKAEGQKEVFLKELAESFGKRKTAFNYFLENEEWDLFMATITETDRLHHFFFDAAYEENHPLHENFVAFYHDVDVYMGRLYDRFREMAGESGRFMVVSDHGFAPIKSEVYVNAYLREKGFLKLNNYAQLFERIEEGSRAFVLDPCRVYLNRKDRYPKGGVSEEEREDVLKELTQALYELKDENGDAVIREVFKAGDIYSGPWKNEGPDLVCLPFDGFDLKGLLKGENVFGKRHFTGMHTRHDAHCVLPASISFPRKPHIENMAKVIVDYFLDD